MGVSMGARDGDEDDDESGRMSGWSGVNTFVVESNTEAGFCICG